MWLGFIISAPGLKLKLPFKTRKPCLKSKASFFNWASLPSEILFSFIGVGIDESFFEIYYPEKILRLLFDRRLNGAYSASMGFSMRAVVT